MCSKFEHINEIKWLQGKSDGPLDNVTYPRAASLRMRRPARREVPPGGVGAGEAPAGPTEEDLPCSANSWQWQHWLWG
jgi:hypothetical protein